MVWRFAGSLDNLHAFFSNYAASGLFVCGAVNAIAATDIASDGAFDTVSSSVVVSADYTQ